MVEIHKPFCEPDSDTKEVMVAFSGGVDSLLIVLTLIQAAPPSMVIRLVNVAFGQDDKAFSEAPDRHLSHLFQYQKLSGFELLPRGRF